MADCQELQRVTTDYVAREDRLRLSGQTADGGVVVLWLTQRLLNFLIPALTDRLKRSDLPGDDLLQTFAQQSAESALEAAPPVPPSEAGWLVEVVDITAGDAGVALTFRAEGASSARLSMAFENMRQWLGIMHGQYGVAGWPTHAWPAWMTEARAPVVAPTPRALH